MEYIYETASRLNRLWLGLFHYDFLFLWFGLYLCLSDILVLLLHFLHKLVVVFHDLCPLCVDEVFLIVWIEKRVHWTLGGSTCYSLGLSWMRRLLPPTVTFASMGFFYSGMVTWPMDWLNLYRYPFNCVMYSLGSVLTSISSWMFSKLLNFLMLLALQSSNLSVSNLQLATFSEIAWSAF